MSVLVPLARRRSTYTPGSLGDFDRVFNNLFQNALTNIGGTAANIGDLAVRINVSETDSAYTVTAELPGIDEKGIELNVQDGLLTLQGEKEAEKEEEGKTFHRVERSFGSFRRILQLPADADEGSVTAAMKDGVLTVDIAKTKQNTKSAKRIDIKRA
jgi:HSP20 family protein